MARGGRIGMVLEPVAGDGSFGKGVGGLGGLQRQCQGTLYELSTWYSTLVLLSRFHLITFPYLPSHAGLSLFDPHLCSIVFLDLLLDCLYINSCHCHR